MTVEGKQRAFPVGGLAALFAATAALPLLALPGEHEPFEYLIAGTFATGISLTTVIVLFIKGRF